MAVVSPPSITPPPTRPDRADRETFAARADAWTIWERDKQVPEMAALGANVAANATDAFTSATTAAAAVGTVAASSSAAAGSSIAAAGSATNAGNSASAAAGSAATATAKAADAETARAASVVAKTASEAAATNSANSATAAANSAAAAQAIAAGDIQGTSPDQFRNNAENDIRFVPNDYPNIDPSVDWNTLTTPQKFTTSTGGVNSPGNYHWSVVVERTNESPLNVTQTAMTRVLGDTQVMRRQYQGLSWTPWVRQANVLRILEVSTGTTAVAGAHYLITASLVLALPAVPAAGDRVGFTNLSGTETASINPGFAKIRGTTGPMVMDNITASAVLTYSGSAQGWV